MQNRDYALSHAAETELINIWNYIAADNPHAADELVDTLTSAMGIIAEMPNMGRIRAEFGIECRSFPIGNYVIFYANILHIIHSRRDIDVYSFQP